MRLENKVALISGGARGMGAVEAHLFAREGAKVAIADILENEGKSIEAYLNQLIEENVEVLCDVRRNPFSRKYGFSKRRLQQAVERVGIEYRHYAELGIPSARRKHLNTQADYDRLFDHYEREMLPDCGSDLDDIMSLLESGKRVALTCFELHSHQCHRSRVAKVMTEHSKWQYNLLNI